MKIKSALLIATLVVGTTQSNAAIFNISNVADGTTELLIASSASALALSGVVTLGYFPSGFLVASNNIPSLISNFTVVNSAPIGQAPSWTAIDTGVTLWPGYAEMPTSDSGVSVGTIIAASPLLNRQVYAFIGNGATLAASSAFGLYSVAVLFEENSGELSYSNLTPDAEFVLGTVGSYTGKASPLAETTTVFRTIILVPEPSTALLGAVGALALLRRRRA